MTKLGTRSGYVKLPAYQTHMTLRAHHIGLQAQGVFNGSPVIWYSHLSSTLAGAHDGTG